MPMACMWAYMVVLPTKPKPLDLRSLERASEASVVTGTSAGLLQAFTRGRPSTKRQR